MNPFKNLAMSVIRTGVPALGALLIGWLTDHFGSLIDAETSAQIIGALYLAAAFIYYVIVRLIETYVTPKIGWLLADFRKGNTAPIYPDAVETTIVPAAPAIEAGTPVVAATVPPVDGVYRVNPDRG